MKVEFIYDPDCPNVAEARVQLLRAFTETGISPRWVEWSRDSARSHISLLIAQTTPLNDRPVDDRT
jgi:hypothetical protein